MQQNERTEKTLSFGFQRQAPLCGDRCRQRQWTTTRGVGQFQINNTLNTCITQSTPNIKLNFHLLCIHNQ